MSEWKQKRFWTDTTVVSDEAGFAIELDGRRVKTPAKAAFAVPTRGLADAIAVEWAAQDEQINPHLMPFTRSANAAIDKVRHQHVEVAEMIAGYGDSDLLCYRAIQPIELIDWQARQWDPALDWAAETLDVRLSVQSGVMHHAQRPDHLTRLSDRVLGMNDFQLAGFHDLVGLSGSLILGFAAAYGWRDADAIWKLSRLDEQWQAEQWGEDEDAEADIEIKRQAFLHAHSFFILS